MKTSIIIALGIGALFLGSFFAVKTTQIQPLGFGDPTFATTAISPKSIAALGITNFAASDGRRKFLQIQNNTSGTIFCLLDGETTAAASTVTSTAGREVGFRITGYSVTSTGSLFQIQGYVGGINCASNGLNTSTVTTGP